jgi:hypothetical protein
VKAVIDGPASITSSEPPSEAVTVLFSGRKLVIEKDRVLLDGEEQATFPADTKSIDVEYKDGALTVAVETEPAMPLGSPR